ncbi:MAG: hypothetical protein ACKVT0_18400 [Planctomycetaceae bacterium]
MESPSKHLLARWQSLENGPGLKKVALWSRVLWVVGFVLSLFVVFGLYHQLNPIVIAAASAVMGWVIAETNALRNRRAQWPLLRPYIDWQRVQADLARNDQSHKSSARGQ